MSVVTINKLNDAYGYVVSDDVEVLKELYDSLTFFVPGYRFMPSYKNGWFDGRVRLMNLNDRTFPLGLTDHICEYCSSKKISCSLHPDVVQSFVDMETRDIDVEDFLASKKFFSKRERIYPREDQLEATVRAIHRKRCLNVCPTSFGKSISITMECLWYIHRGMRCLIIVPTKDLVDQFYNDIKDYATNEDGELEHWYPVVQRIYSGKTKELENNTDICISTWQSLSKIEDDDYLNQFDVIIIDEVHRAKGAVIQSLMLKATEVKYRTGWTGSLDEEQISELLVKGLFGPEKTITTTKELMDKSIVANLSIQILRLRYPDELCKDLINLDYHGQSTFIEQYQKRTNLLLRIVGTQTKTGLIFYKHIAHGEEIFEKARQMYPERNVYLVHGGHFQLNDTKYKTFEDIKALIEEDENAIVIANYQLASTGISIKHLYWMMFFVPIKSFISTVQSIGRVLRVSKKKTKALLIDIVDDFSYKKRTKLSQNYAVKHFGERFSIYNVNQFDYKIKTINIGDTK